jgi:hypothetical protein
VLTTQSQCEINQSIHDALASGEAFAPGMFASQRGTPWCLEAEASVGEAPTEGNLIDVMALVDANG